MEMERIEYVRKNTRRKGRKKGVLFCGIDPEDANAVVIGFSLCNAVDRFDYIQGKPMPGFGLETAKIRAEKWRLHIQYFVQNSFTEDMVRDGIDGIIKLKYLVNPNSSEVVEIPPSIKNRLSTFILRCRKYYKDKEFPEWIETFEKDEPIPRELIDTKYLNF